MFRKKKEVMPEDGIFDMELLDEGEEEEALEAPAPKKKSGNKKLLVLLLAGVVAIGAIFGVVALALTPESLPRVETIKLERGSITSYLNTSGTVNSMNTKTYFSPVNASVNSATLKVGDVVTEGQQLVTFDTSSLERDNQRAELTEAASIHGNRDTVSKAEQAQSKAANAASRIAALETDIANYQQYIQDCNTYISQRTRELTETSNNIGLQIEQVQGSMTSLQSEMQMLDAQYAEEPSDESYLAARENLQSQLDSLNQQYYDLKVQLNSVSNPATDESIIYYNNEIASAQNELAGMQSDLAEQEGIKSTGESSKLSDNARAQLEANSNLASLESSTVAELLEKGRRGISAEFGGVISKVGGAVNGTAVTQGMELVSVSSNQQVQVDITIPKNDYDKVKEGQSADITIGDKQYQGTVSGISKIARQNEKGAAILTAEVVIDNPDADIFLGVEAKVKINLGTAENVLVAPMEIVNSDTEGNFCYVLHNGVIGKKTVETGAQQESQVEIVSGLEETDVVIPTLPDNLKVGMRAEPMTQAEIDAQDAYKKQIQDALDQLQ